MTFAEFMAWLEGYRESFELWTTEDGFATPPDGKQWQRIRERLSQVRVVTVREPVRAPTFEFGVPLSSRQHPGCSEQDRECVIGDPQHPWRVG